MCVCAYIYNIYKYIYSNIIYIYKIYYNIYNIYYIYIYMYIYTVYISSCYGSIPLTLGLIGRDGGLSTLCHSFGFACQQRVLKTFPGLGYFCSEDGVVCLYHLLVNLYIYIARHFILLRLNPFDLRVDKEGRWFEYSVS